MTTRLQQRLIDSQRHFRKACEQFAILDRQLEELSLRIREADASGHRILRYSIRLRMSVMEGVRNMFYEFAAIKSTEIVELQRRVLEEEICADEDHDADVSALDEILQDFFSTDESSDDEHELV